MPIWLVKATWTEDDAEASEQWEVKADTARDAVREVTTHLRFPPHHIEAKLRSAEGAGQMPEIGHPRDRVHRISTR